MFVKQLKREWMHVKDKLTYVFIILRARRITIINTIKRIAMRVVLFRKLTFAWFT